MTVLCFCLFFLFSAPTVRLGECLNSRSLVLQLPGPVLLSSTRQIGTKFIILSGKRRAARADLCAWCAPGQRCGEGLVCYLTMLRSSQQISHSLVLSVIEASVSGEF